MAKRLHENYTVATRICMLRTKIILRTDAPHKDGTCLVCLQCFINKKRIVIPLKVYLNPKHWIEDDQCIDVKEYGNKKRASDMQRIIEDARSRATDISTRYHLSRKLLTPELFREEFLQEHLNEDFLRWMEKEIPKLAGQRSPGTVKWYWNAWKHFRNYRPSVSFGELNYQCIMQYDNYLRRQGLQLNTRYVAHKVIKTFINHALRSGIRIDNPYKDYKVRQEYHERNHLTEEELKRLRELYALGRLAPEQQEILGAFLFCTNTGLRISDIKRMTCDDIIGDELVFVPAKTRHKLKVVRIPLNATAWSYIKVTTGKLYVMHTDQNTNRQLKEICCYAGITRKLSFHTARHTFATQFLKAGGKVEVLKELMGHSKLETTMAYVHVINSEKRRQVMLMDDVRI